MKLDLTKIKAGDVMSESSHYVVKTVEDGKAILIHQETMSEVQVKVEDLEERMISADQYSITKTVTRKDRKNGESGIKSIFRSIPEGAVFTVTYQKRDQRKSKKVLEAEKESRMQEVISNIQKARNQKKSMSKKCIDEVKRLLENPIIDTIPGEIRVLRGRKLHDSTKDGYYHCLDMDIQKTEKDSGERLVNINTISELIYNGIKYTIK